MILAGVEIPHDRGLLAHSDGDVLLHAVTDALLGALGLGDIGRWFPDTDARWKNAASTQFVEAVVLRMKEMGWCVGNVDVTVVCQTPRLAGHISAMQSSLARLLLASDQQVNIKATTTEGLGFTGRGEGIACHCVALLQRMAA